MTGFCILIGCRIICPKPMVNAITVYVFFDVCFYYSAGIQCVKISCSSDLLRREIPMAWGTTTNSLTPEINLSQYAIEIKCLTLKD